MARILTLAVCCAAYVATAGCSTPYQDELGSTHVAVLSVTPWEDYRAELAPKYELTAEKARELAVADSLQVEEVFLDALRTRLGAQFAPSGVLQEGFGATTLGGESETGVTRAGENIPDGSFETDSPRIRREGAPSAIDAKTLRSDAFLSYLAATALFQEVKMLNRYVQDASIRNDYTPYIVRLQVTNLPVDKENPYDVYSNIAFFNSPVGLPAREYQNKIVQYIYDFMRGILQHEVQHLPVVVPLLVTDNVEAALRARRTETLLQIAGAVSAAYAGIGGEFDFEKVNQQLRDTLGRDYNSLFTVGRLADNAVRVRIGARQSPGDGEFQSTPQTHNVTLLVLVKGVPENGHKDVFVGTVSRYWLAKEGEGKWVKAPKGREFDSESEDLFARGGYDTLPGISRLAGDEQKLTELRLELATLAQNGQYAEFMKTALFGASRDIGPASAHRANANRLWLDLISARVGSQHDATSFQVRYVDNDPAFPSRPEAKVFAIDDTKTMRATVIGVNGLDPAKVTAWLEWGGKDANGNPSNAVAATSAELQGRSQLVLNFPSLAGKKLVAPPLKSTGYKIVVRYPGLENCDGANKDEFDYDAVVSFANPTQPVGLAIQRAVTRLSTGKDRELELGFLLTSTPAGITLPADGIDVTPDEITNAVKNQTAYVVTVSGARVSEIDPESKRAERVLVEVPGTLQSYVVVQKGNVTLTLASLSGEDVTVSVTPPKGAPPVEDLVFKVAPASTPAPNSGDGGNAGATPEPAG
ncbi:MAG: hypothetical protein AAF612_03280 [Planctomycetota bacterium]